MNGTASLSVRGRRRGAILLPLALAACTRNFGVLQRPPRHAAALTGGTWASMIYAAKVDGGVILVDLGWDGDGDALRATLARLDAAPGDVAAVFLTHGHRDHIAAWRAVRHAPFYLGADEVAPFLGHAPYRGFVPKLAARIRKPDRPGPGDLALHALAGDTAIAFGADTIRAFALPGHTPGSMAYLVRGTLFVGDAVTWTPIVGFHSARREYSDDVARSKRSLAALWDRIAGLGVAHVCTAHGKCAPMDSTFRRRALR